MRRKTPDPVSIVNELGGQWSPDFDAYASGRLDISQVRCVLCGQAPCQCRFCEGTYHNVYHLATGRPEFEPCGFGLDPDGSCPRCGEVAR